MPLTSHRTRALIGALIVTLLAACGGEANVVEGATEDLPSVVPLGKEDNYLAPKAQEYIVEGRTTVTLDKPALDLSADERLAEAKRLIPYKQVVIGWFLNSWIVSKSSKSENKDYGDFHALTKNGSYEELDIVAVDDLTYEFTFRQEIGGPLNLLDKMPTATDTDGRLYSDLVIGRIANDDMVKLETNKEWYRKAPWSAFDPSKVDGAKLDTIRLFLTPQPRSIDAWLDYERLFADGKVTVGVHFGWDYHNEYHLRHSRSVYEWLVDRGYRSPVQSYDELTRTSGPLTRTITANGRRVDIEVSLYWGKPGTDTDPDTDAGGKQLEVDMIESLESRDVIVYSGHSGPFYGFALGNWKKTAEGDLDDSEIAALDLPRDYQIVLAEGCETYALGQAFWGNPAKGDRTNLDIITTTSFSNASTSAAVTDFLSAIAGTGWNDDTHRPRTWGELLEDLDRNSSWFTTMYGVHGIDDNPHLHPYADATAFCGTCNTNSDCGAEGNFCARMNGEGICTAACTADTGCPDGFSCTAVAHDQAITGRACVPTNLSCEAPSSEPSPLIISELLAMPAYGLDGDINGDGVSDLGDQFVEIVNVGDTAFALGGTSLADGQMVRFRFPDGATVLPGQRVVVFSSPASIDAGDALFFSAELDLDAGGDSLTLRTADGRVLDGVAWGHEGGQAAPLVRDELSVGAPLSVGGLPTPGQ